MRARESISMLDLVCCTSEISHISNSASINCNCLWFVDTGSRSMKPNLLIASSSLTEECLSL
jgi:hypothetical protein